MHRACINLSIVNRICLVSVGVLGGGLSRWYLVQSIPLAFIIIFVALLVLRGLQVRPFFVFVACVCCGVACVCMGVPTCAGQFMVVCFFVFLLV